MSQSQLPLATESQPQANTGIVLLQQDELHAVMKLDYTLQACRSQLLAAEDQPVLKAIVLARATNQIRKLLTDKMMQDIMELMGSPLGFRTDKDKEERGYSVGVVRDIAIVAAIDGARLVGNEFNIIAGNYYRTKEQLKRRILEWEGLSNFRYDTQIAETYGEKGAAVACRASWRLNGNREEIVCEKNEKGDFRIAVRVNSGQGQDAIKGKAERKLFLKVWERLRGQEVQDWDPDEGGEPPSVDQTIDATLVKTAAAQPTSEPSSQQEAPQTQSSEASEPTIRPEIASAQSMFEQAKSLTDVKDLYFTANQRFNDLNALEATTLIKWRDAANERIRGVRGERSDKKQGK